MVDDNRVAEALKLDVLNLPESPSVKRIDYVLDTDSVGDPAIFVTVVLAEDTPDEARDWPHLEPLEETIRDALRGQGVERWPYFRFRTEAELRQAG